MNSEHIGRWFQDRGDSTLLLNYPLDEDSVVLDVGGYKGNWSASILDKYNPYICIFEPVKEFYEVCKNRFKDNPKITVLNYGFSNKHEEQTICLCNDASAVSAEGACKVTLEDIATAITTKVDLISINIEGSEYNVLPRMIESGIVKLCKYIQVQFHWKGVENCVQMRDEVRRKLAETHTETYCYPFVWESWRRNV